MKSKIFVYFGILLFAFISIYKMYSICFLNKDKYLVAYEETVRKEITLDDSPRGKILDCTGKVLVDNVGVSTLIYNSLQNSKVKLTDIAIQLAAILEVDNSKITEDELKTFYLKINNDGDNLITSKEKKLYKERKLNSEDILNLKLSRITSDMLDNMDTQTKWASHIYYLLNKGYSYENKTIKEKLTDEEKSAITKANIPGVNIIMKWERIYPYGDVLKSIFGNISTNGVTKELKEHYEDKNIRLNSTVGVSGLELYYDDYLRGKDAVYTLSSNSGLTLKSEEIAGNDLYLSIDIEKQLEIESILKEEMLKAKKAKNTELYNHSYVMIGNPSSGGIVAVAGFQIVDDHFVDITSNIVSMSYTVGSIVKGATTAVGYDNNLIQIGEKVVDSCIKVKNVTKKCSWKSLGRLSDVDAIAQSSNYFQFLIAVRLSNPNYKWNSPLNATKEHFDIYRNMLSSYGLGSLTNIDFPNEKIGIIGKSVKDDLLLNLSIGQYDTYTPAEVLQYTNTLASRGQKRNLHFVDKIVSKDNKVIYENETTPVSSVNLDEKYMNRIQEGLKAVMTRGTGKNYTSRNFASGGKTGTSETFIDTDEDGKIDTETISTAFIMYAPFDNPKYTIAILSPHIAVKRDNYTYKYNLNLYLNQKISKYLFEN